MSNYYAKAIQILANNNIDYIALVYKIAEFNPKAVVMAEERVRIGHGWQKECAALVASGQKLRAIKRCREITGMGLAEAKFAVEELV